MLSVRRGLVWVLATLAVAVTVAVVGLPIHARSGSTEWRAFGGNLRATRYSPLDQINKDTVKRLKVVWRQSALPAEMRDLGGEEPAKSGSPYTRVDSRYVTTPLMVNGLLYVQTAIGTVAALDPATGRVAWFDKPVLPAGPSRHARAISYWTDGKDSRIISVNGRYLVAVNAKTGARYPDFGENGQVDLLKGSDESVFAWSSGPSVVIRDVVVVAAAGQGDVRGFDVRTGKQLWLFHLVPRPGEFGNDTWEGDSWSRTSAKVWPPMSADEDLGYVYLPVSTPQNDFYGGHRHGDGLFGESILALDAKTGQRVWYFQLVHHGLFDYDLPCPPVLTDVTIKGEKRRLLAQPTKQGYLFVLDRVTGKPVWPIEERPVPQSDAPGEKSSPTQPIPLDARGQPFAYDQQGATIDDLIDFTPELRAEAVKILQQWDYGERTPYTPLVLPGVGKGVGKTGTIQMPGTTGATSWTGAAFDPDTNILYVPSWQKPTVGWLKKMPSGSQYEYMRERHEPLIGPQGLPLFKPPYGRLVAIDLSQGLIKWTVPNGEGPRDHPALKGLNLPRLGNPSYASPLVTKSLVFLGEGYPRFSNYPLMGGKMFRAYDKATGDVVWEKELDGATTGTPITYSWRGKQYIVAAIGWPEQHPMELIALAVE